MEETVDGASSGFEKQSESNLNHGNKDVRHGSNSEQGQKVDNLHSEGAGRENVNKNKGKQSYASLFKENRTPVDASMLKFIAPTDGEVVIGEEDVDSVESTFGYCLVGYVIGARPNAYAVLNFIKGWGGNARFVFMDNGWIKFQFATEMDRDRVLNGGTYLIMGRRLFLKKLPSCFLFRKEDMETIPTWVQIFGLPKDCWTAPALSRIASVVGIPIHTDMLTISKKGATYARVLVEIDAKKPRLWDYIVRLPSGATLVKFKYEFESKFCDRCRSMGHTTETCGLENRKKQNAQHTKPGCTQPNSSGTTNDAEKITTVDNTSGYDNAVPESGGTKENAETVIEQHPPDMQQKKYDKGKGIATDYSEKEAGKSCDEARMEDENSIDGHDFDEFRSEGYYVDSEDIEDILSPIKTKDNEEWKQVSNKKKKVKTKKIPKKTGKKKKLESGASSLDTEFVPVDPNSKIPVKGRGTRFFKKDIKEVRPPNTASGCP